MKEGRNGQSSSGEPVYASLSVSENACMNDAMD